MAAMFIQPVVPQRRERHFRERDGLSLDFSDRELRERYRFSLDSIYYLSNLLQHDLARRTQRNHALTVTQQLLVTLRYLASGNFMQVIGDTLGLDKGTISRVVRDVVTALCSVKNTFIKWPTRAATNETKSSFYNLAGVPNVIGAIDGMHIRIIAPSNDEPSYVNRKGFHSINVQAVCDAEGRFTNINASWPGSTHDAHILRTLEVCAYLERNNEIGFLLGDSGYPCRPFLMTPYLHPVSRAMEKFNDSQMKTRAVIERTFGRWKRKFHILHSEIRLKPAKVCRIVIACAVLHNISILLKEPQDDEDLHEPPHQDLQIPHGLNQDGRGVRDHITQTFFSN